MKPSSEATMGKHGQAILDLIVDYQYENKINPLELCVILSTVQGFLMIQLHEHSLVQEVKFGGNG